MAWLRLDDQYDDHPKVVAAGNDGQLLDLRAMLFCARRGTDGFVPYTQLPALSRSLPKPERLPARLVEVGRWHDDPDSGGWWVHDYLTYNPPASDQEAEREAARERMQVARESRVRAKEPPNGNGSSSDVRANNNRTSPNPHPQPPSASSKHLPDADFDEFWQAYPRHVAKKSAQKAWRTRIKAGRTPEELIRAAKNYAIVKRGTDQEFIMYPSTFLGPQERYEDFLEMPKAPSTTYETVPTNYR